jgi:multidrug transporter EmrE-like cation transporter
MTSRLVDTISSPSYIDDAPTYSAPAPLAPSGRERSATPWSFSHRVAFRFAFAYLMLYNLPFPLGSIPLVKVVDRWYDQLWHALVPWIGAHVLFLAHPITVLPNGSGDTTFNYVQDLTRLVLAVVATVIWSAADRKRSEYRTLHHWLRVYVRYVLAFTMLSYGAFKVIKSQFPAPPLERLLEPYGEFSPMGVLWSFMGYSTAYNVFTGLGEMIGGALLFFRRTTTVGALLLITVLANVVILNFAYDVPVKLYSSALLLMAIFLIVPETKRLWTVFVSHRVVAPANIGMPAIAKRLNIARRVAKIGLVGLAVFAPLKMSYDANRQFGDAAPKPPLFGIYDVESFSKNGVMMPPLLTDTVRWRRLVVSRPGGLSVKLMSDSTRRYLAKVDTVTGRLTLWTRADSTTRFPFSFIPTDDGGLLLNGAMSGDSLRVRLRRVDHTKFLLVSRGYHWINEYPFNR